MANLEELLVSALDRAGESFEDLESIEIIYGGYRVDLQTKGESAVRRVLPLVDLADSEIQGHVKFEAKSSHRRYYLHGENNAKPKVFSEILAPSENYQPLYSGVSPEIREKYVIELGSNMTRMQQNHSVYPIFGMFIREGKQGKIGDLLDYFDSVLSDKGEIRLEGVGEKGLEALSRSFSELGLLFPYIKKYGQKTTLISPQKRTRQQ